MKEAEERKKLLQNTSKPDFLQFLSPLNTFEGLTLNNSCRRSRVYEEDSREIAKIIENKQVFMPIYALDFSENRILEDCLSIIWHFLIFSHLTHHEKSHEKEKLKRFLKLIFVNTLQIPLKIIEKNNENIEESINIMRKKLYEYPQITNNNSIFNNNFDHFNHNATRISQEILEDLIEKNIIKPQNISEPAQISQTTDSKFKILNPFASKTLNFLNETRTNPSVFWPEATEKDAFFYGTKNLYVFLRFFYTFYEQFLMAYQLSQKFEDTCTGDYMSYSEKRDISKERYRLFKLLILKDITQKIEGTLFENLLRGLFGNNSFLLATSNKILISVLY